MKYTIETLADVSYIIIQDGNDIHQIPLEAIASWGTLLGQTDPGETLEAILQYREPESGENIWGGLYEAMGVGLDELAKAGVPPIFADELLQDTSAPLPTKEVREMLDQVRQDSKESIRTSSTIDFDVDSLKTELLENYGEEIREGRINFIDKIQPVYEVKPPEGKAY